MAQTGVLDYQRYLNTLQTLNDLGQTFPSNKQTYNFSVVGGTTASWTATISWETLVLDKVSFSSKATGYIPNVDNSQVIGYIDGGTSTQYSTGVISIPANMYTGPILPGGDYHVPLTVVHLQWFNGVTTYAQQIGFIQNWEPGVEIGDPTTGFDYHPVYSLPSALTLSGQAGLIYGDDLTLTATSDIPLDLTGLKCRFYKKTGDVLLGEGTFSGSSANFTITTTGNFAVGSYEFYAISPPFKNFLTARSNDFTVVVASGVPLIVTTSTFTPNKSYYFVGETVTYNLGVVPDPLFTATGVAIANTVTIKLIDTISPYTETTSTSNFVNGQTQYTFNVESHMVDVNRLYPQTTYTITNSILNFADGIYTATLRVYNTETVTSTWDSQYIGRYASGSTSTSFIAANTATVTVVAQPFPITISQSSTNTFVTEEFIITVSTPAVAYYSTLTIYAQKGATIESIYSGNNSGTGSFTASVYISSSTGTWTLYASYPGDLGQSLINANSSSTSNSLNHFIRNGNELLPTPVLNFYRTPDNDILEVRASTSTTLTNIVSFYEGTTLLGTAEWSRESGTFFYPVSTTRTYKTSGFARNFEVLAGPLTQTGWGGDNPVTYDANNFPSMVPYRYYTGSSQYAIYNSQGTFPPPISYRSQTWQDIWQASNGNALEDQEINTNIYDTTPYPLRRLRINGANSNGKITAIGWASPISSTSTYKDSYNNRYALNPNMKKLNQLEAGGPYGKFPNKYTLFKYYDGTNYNLTQIKSTSTDVYAIADPIEFGTQWYNEPYYIALGAGTKPYRIDTIGDPRGYNVIAIEASGVRPLSDTPEGYAETLRYSINSSNTLTDIQLVEFIGTVTWSTPIIESAIWANYPTQWYPNPEHTPPAEYTNQITAWLYKFTPEIPNGGDEWWSGTGRQYRSQYPWQDAVNYTRAFVYGTAQSGEYGLDPDFTNFLWKSYGKKNWGSTTSTVGGAFFNAVTNPLGTTVYTQAGAYGPSHTQTAVLILPRNSISTVSNVHAVWTGTQNLSTIYGKYYGFDIYVTSATTAISLQGYNLRDGNALLNVADSIVRDSNAVRLVANVDFISALDPDAEITGSVVFYEEGTNYKFGVSTITNKVATLDVYGNQLFATGRPKNPYAPSQELWGGTKSVHVRARFTSTNYGVNHSISTSKAIVSTYELGESYQAFNGSTSTLIITKGYTTPSGKTQTNFYGSFGFRVPFFATGSGTGSMYFRFTYSTNIGAGWSTPVALPMSPSNYNSYPVYVVDSNTLQINRPNSGEFDGRTFSFSFYNLSVPISGGGQVKVYVDVWSVNARIPTSAQVGIHEYTNFQHI